MAFVLELRLWTEEADLSTCGKTPIGKGREKAGCRENRGREKREKSS